MRLTEAQRRTLVEMRDGPLWETPRCRRTFAALQREGLVEKARSNIFQRQVDRFINVTENFWKLTPKGKKLVLREGLSWKNGSEL